MAKKPLSQEEFMARLKGNAAYSHIDIDRELGKATAWCEVNNRQCTQRFFVNWLNRIDKPLTPPRRFEPGREGSIELPPFDPVCPVCGKEYCLQGHRN